VRAQWASTRLLVSEKVEMFICIFVLAGVGHSCTGTEVLVLGYEVLEYQQSTAVSVLICPSTGKKKRRTKFRLGTISAKTCLISAILVLWVLNRKCRVPKKTDIGIADMRQVL
jgi:hypothetical protein